MITSLPDRIRTPRLTLRAPRPSDARVLFGAYTQDLNVARYMTWRPHKALAQTESFIDYCMRGWEEGHSRTYLLVPEDSDDTPVGMLEARLAPHMIDIGYVLARSHWGDGLMTEAVRAFTEVALALPEYFRVQATCDADNRASARTLEKSGFKLEGRLERHTIIPNLGAEPRASFMYARWR